MMMIVSAPRFKSLEAKVKSHDRNVVLVSEMYSAHVDISGLRNEKL